jgi:RES domain-containing protein
MIVAWRIGTDTPNYTAEDVSGTGAKITGGRWNRPGVAVIYASTSRALACLETIVHLGAGRLPLNRYLVQIDIPDGVWKRRQKLTNMTAPIGWDAIPAGKVSLDAGDHWIKSAASCVMEVPSILVPEEGNVLINPSHPDALGIKVSKIRRWDYDHRLIP